MRRSQSGVCALPLSLLFHFGNCFNMGITFWYFFSFWELDFIMDGFFLAENLEIAINISNSHPPSILNILTPPHYTLSLPLMDYLSQSIQSTYQLPQPGLFPNFWIYCFINKFSVDNLPLNVDNLLFFDVSVYYLY